VAFTGHTEASIDAKRRLALPAKFRARWSPKTDGPTWYCLPWPETGALRLYPEALYESLKVGDSDEMTLTPSRDQADLEAAIYGSTEQLDVDANNRIVIPAWHLELLNLPREVVVVGAGSRLEIRARDAWAKDHERMLSQLQKLAAKRNPSA